MKKISQLVIQGQLPDTPATYSLSQLCHAAGLDILYDNHENDYPGRNYLRIIAALNELSDDESLHLSSRRMLPGTTRFVINNLYNSNTLQALLSQIASGFNFVHGGNFNFTELHGRQLTYIIDDREFSYDSNSRPESIRMALDSAMMLVHGIIKTCCPQARLTAVHSRNDKDSVLPWLIPDSLIHLHDDSYRLQYAAEGRDLPVNARILSQVPMSQLYLAAFELANLPTLSLREKVSQKLRQGQFNQEVIAEELHLSVATLRRKLAEQNTSFRSLCEEHRNSMAKELLRQGLPLCEISAQLAFADERSFNRAFKQWNGITPRKFKNDYDAVL